DRDPDGGTPGFRGARAVRLRSGARRRPDRHRDREDAPRGGHDSRPAVPSARSREGLVRMKALITGVAGFIGSNVAEELLRRGATVTGIDCFTDYYARPIKEANVAAVSAHRGFTFVETSIQDANLPALLDGVTHLFHLAAQAGVRKSWGKDFQI